MSTRGVSAGPGHAHSGIPAGRWITPHVGLPRQGQGLDLLPVGDVGQHGRACFL